MIFPHARLSELQRETRENRAAFEQSRHHLRALIREKSKPAVFFRDHYKAILTLLATSVPATKILRLAVGKVLFGKNSRWIKKVLKMGWVWKLGKWAGLTALKTMGPTILGTLKLLFKHGFRALFH